MIFQGLNRAIAQIFAAPTVPTGPDAEGYEAGRSANFDGGPPEPPRDLPINQWHGYRRGWAAAEDWMDRQW